jgi:hypothetical protein
MRRDKTFKVCANHISELIRVSLVKVGVTAQKELIPFSLCRDEAFA